MNGQRRNNLLPRDFSCTRTKYTKDLGILAPQILGFDITWGHVDIFWPKLWHNNGVFGQIWGCSGHFDVSCMNTIPFNIYVKWDMVQTAMKVNWSHLGGHGEKWLNKAHWNVKNMFDFNYFFAMIFSHNTHTSLWMMNE